MNGRRHPPLLVGWALVAVVGLSWGLGSYPLVDQDEGRNGEVAREMAATNDYVVPHLDGLPYVDKPVLWFAATAVVMEILGPTELAARSVSWLCALATALLVGWCGGRWFGTEAGWLAGIAAATAPLPLAFARIAILDSLVALLVTSAILAFHTAVEARLARRPERIWTVAAWVAIGLGVLTKGPVALALPLLVAAPYAAWRRGSWAVWNPIGPLAMIVVVAPWVSFMEARLPGYLQYVAVTETWQRVASDELRRSQPWWFYGAVAVGGFFPWWPFAFGRRRLDAGGDPHRVLLWLWLLLPLMLFSLSRSKMPQYILPLMPAVALLAASRWRTGERPSRPVIGVIVAGLGLLGAAFAAAAAGAFDGRGLPPTLLMTLPTPASVMASVCLVALVWILVAARRHHGPGIIAALSLPAVAVPIVLHLPISTIAEWRSQHDLVARIHSELPPDTEVLGLTTWRPSLSFYLRRTVPILTSIGNELRSNYILHTKDRWMSEDGPLRPFPATLTAFGRCARPRVIFVHRDQIELIQGLVDAGLREFATQPSHVAYLCDPDHSPVGAPPEGGVLRSQSVAEPGTPLPTR